MKQALQDAMQKYVQVYSQLDEKDKLDLSKHEYVAIAMAAEALNMQKNILERIAALEKENTGRRSQMTPEELVIQDLHARSAGQAQEWREDIEKREQEENSKKA